MAVSKKEDQVRLVLVGRKTQYITGMGILYRGKGFGCSEAHAARLIKAKNRATGEALFILEEEYERRLKLEAMAAGGDDSLDLGLGQPAAKSTTGGDTPTVETV